MLKIFFIFLLTITTTWAGTYPAHWWEKIPESQRQGNWEILPQEAKKGEVILSKRNELGVFSNLGHAPFELDGISYESIEGLWQGMKYPDLQDSNDRRNTIGGYPYTREEVYLLHGFDAKKAGDMANKINRAHHINWVSYLGHQFNYKDHASGSDMHYRIIYRATLAKVMQNPQVKALLIKTKGLILKPDHHQGPNQPRSYAYYQILMDIRDTL